MLEPQPQPIVHTTNVHVTVQGGHPPLFVRLFYFLFIGWWFGILWVLCAIFLICLILTAPLGFYMLYKSPKAFVL